MTLAIDGERRVSMLARFYVLLDLLEGKMGGARRLAECDGRSGWPDRGVYFFREAGENRTESGDGPRVVRVGTHALKASSRTTIWNRLAQHRGATGSGGGHHRGSIFRLITGTALGTRDGNGIPTWGLGSSAPKTLRESELIMERRVSKEIGAMPFLWLEIGDEAGPESRRGFIERNAIALLSNYGRPPVDPASVSWLGRHCDRQRVRESGLWNSNHVDESPDPRFLDEFERLIWAGGSGV